MRIYQLLQALVEKFVPMDAQSNNELSVDAVNFYNAIKEERLLIIKENQLAIEQNLKHVNDKDFTPIAIRVPSLKHKIVGYLEQWWVRYIIAILFIYLVPAISRFISGGNDDGEEYEDDDMKNYMEFKRFKKSML